MPSGGVDDPDPSGVAANFNRSFANVQAPWAVWTETPTGGATNFLTGAGGFLQAALFGFPGLRLVSSGGADAALTFRFPTLVPGSPVLRLRGLCWRGGAFDVALLADGANGAGPSFQVAHTGGGGSFQIGPAGGDGTALEQGGPAVAFDMVPGSNFELCEAS